METTAVSAVSVAILDTVLRVLVFAQQRALRSRHRLILGLWVFRCLERMLVIWGFVVMLVIMGIVLILLVWSDERLGKVLGL